MLDWQNIIASALCVYIIAKALVVLEQRPGELYKMEGLYRLPELLERVRGELEQLRIQAQQSASEIISE